jgi:N-acetylmuramoyl-L-alanine amidase
VRRLAVVVLDAAHGGTDPGARGANGVVEKDVVLALTRIVRSELERLGFRVVLTREGDQNPSFDDRAAIANAQHGGIFISLHVSSTGPGGTARAYSYESSAAPTIIPVQTSPAGAPATPPARIPAGWIEWDTAQKPFADQSRRLADVLQVELSQKFPGSPEISSAAAVRELHSIAAPAAAVELSSVTVDDAITLQAMAPALATAIGRAVLAFRPLYESEGK